MEENPYAPTSLTGNSTSDLDRSDFGTALRIFTKHFGIVSGIIFLILFPIDLLADYLDAFYFSQDDFTKSFRLQQALSNLIGVVASGAFVQLARMERLGEQPSLYAAISASLFAWPMFFATHLISGILLIIGFVLLVIPAVIMAIRFSFVDSIIMSEERFGEECLRRSWKLCKGRMGEVISLIVITIALYVAGGACILVPAVVLPDYDNWFVNSILSLPTNYVTAYSAICFYCMYHRIMAESGNQDEVVESQSTADYSAP